MTEHSMCRPACPPRRGGIQEGSPSLDAFQRAKSRGFFFFSSTSTWPRRPFLERALGELA
jgi:hypothetical protein